MRLVNLLDEVLENAERQPEFRFTLDGQMTAVDDYLEVRPENTDRLRALVATGQLVVGPQILAGAGFRHACVWRGVPAAVDRHAFRWVAPDGSWVRTEYLPGGYSNAAFLFDDPSRSTPKRSTSLSECARGSAPTRCWSTGAPPDTGVTSSFAGSEIAAPGSRGQDRTRCCPSAA